jgi:hypothetical protein
MKGKIPMILSRLLAYLHLLYEIGETFSENLITVYVRVSCVYVHMYKI